MLNNKININIKLHENVKTSYQNLADVLKSEREKQYTMIDELDLLWSGSAKETFKQLYTATLESGDYETLRSKIVAIADIMDCSLVEIKRQKSICDTLCNCLDGKPASDSEIVSGNLALDSINVVKIDSECDGIVDSCNRAKEKLEEAMALCGNLVNFCSCADELDRAYSKVMRIKDLQDAIDDYRIAVKNIDAGLQDDYGNWKKTQLVSTITLNQGSGETNISSIEFLTGESLEEMLEERGLTVEEYNSSILDTLMYMDFFDDDLKHDYKYEDIAYDLYDGMTLIELIEILGRYYLYTTETEGSTRYIYYKILKEAVELEPSLGNYQISYMSRRLTSDDTGMEYNSGTNGMVFTNPADGSVYVAFRGTSMGEWVDNGNRLSCKGIDDLTPQMEQSLNYFNYVAENMGWTDEMKIYVTGHSQGGNDAQNVFLLSEYGKYVDACYSFDGEGHSPDLLDDIERKWGTEEYENRRSRMYSICGEYDFVNHLGEKVIPEENTKYIKCNFRLSDIARYHDIISMFGYTDGKTDLSTCKMEDVLTQELWNTFKDISSLFSDKYHNYGGMINTSIGTGASFVTLFTSNVWDEIDDMPDDMRASCQRALMNAAEYLLSNKECSVGLNGEKATVWDYLVTVRYGLDALKDASKDVAVDYCGGAMTFLAESIIDTTLASLPSEEREAIESSLESSTQTLKEAVSFVVNNEIWDLKKYGKYIITSDIEKEYFEIGCNTISELAGIGANAIKEIGDTLADSWDKISSSSDATITGKTLCETVCEAGGELKDTVINTCVEAGKVVVDTGKEFLETASDEVQNIGKRVDTIKENFGEWGENLIHNMEIKIGTDFIKGAMNN
jgi:hypothetical protein